MEIVLASAQLDLRLALEILLREEPGTRVVGTASEAASLRSLLQASRPDMVLLDWDLPGHPRPAWWLKPKRSILTSKSLFSAKSLKLRRLRWHPAQMPLCSRAILPISFGLPSGKHGSSESGQQVEFPQR